MMIEQEQWLTVPFAKQYQASTLGRIRRNPSFPHPNSHAIDGVLKPVTRGGYPAVSLVMNDGSYKSRLVHRIVCETFHGPCPAGFQAAHWDGDTTNSRPDNIRWASPSENIADKRRHGTAQIGERANGSKLTEEQVREIRRHPKKRGVATMLGQRFGVSRFTINRVQRGDGWQHVS